MATIFENREFHQWYDQESGRTFDDLQFRKCLFVSSAVSITTKVHKRSTLRNIRLLDCEVVGCTVHAAIIEDVLVDGLTTDDLLAVRGAAFRHVVLKGKIGSIKIGPWVMPSIAKPRVQQAFDDANAAYYSTVDWALDIREALFVTCDLRGVPAGLIRRDPETQVVVTREKALAGTWRQLNLYKTYWPVSLQWFLDSGEADIVLVAPKRDLKYRYLLEGLQVLREAGVANPD
jgi:hypothetical protein